MKNSSINNFFTKQLSRIFVFLISTLSLAQNGPIKTPSIAPPSPTAYEMTRYGNTPVNESTGNISPSIPLYTYKAGDLTLPISLSYQGNGVKVDQASTWTGINWNLLAGGAITRTVKGNDDLIMANTKKVYSYEELQNMDLGGLDINQDKKDLAIFIENPNIDSEVDIFNFSFPGYSGSFYFDLNGNPHLTKNDTPLKIKLDDEPPIDVNGISQTFKREIIITTPNGVKHYFGGLNASERSSSASSIINASGIPFQTTFYLSKMVNPKGDEIRFTYSPGDYYTMQNGISEIRTVAYDVPSDITNLDECTSLFNNVTSQGMYTRIEDGHFLAKITSNRNDFEIIFNSVKSNNAKHYQRYLNNIEVVNLKELDTEKRIERKINLKYLFPKGIEESERFFLETVNFEGKNFKKGYSYNLLYKFPNLLPKRFSYDQDYAGYYNGKNNITIIPKVDLPEFANINHLLADKSADFNFSSLGSLQKITYPTGGYTVFEYENHANGTFNTNVYTETKSFYSYIDDPTRNPNSKNPSSVNIGNPIIIGGDPNDIKKTVKQTINIRLFNVYSTELIDTHTQFIVKVEDINNGVITYNSLRAYNFNDGTETAHPYHGYVYYFPSHVFTDITLEKDHDYKISLEIKSGGPTLTSKPVINANIDFSYKYYRNEPDTSKDCGLRIKRVTDYSSTNSIADIKRYHYGSGSIFLNPRYIHSTKAVICEDAQRIKQCYLINLASNSINALYSIYSNQKMYQSVKISYGGDNYEKGGVEKEFVLETDPSPNYFLGTGHFAGPNAKENRSVVNGTLLKEIHLEKTRDGEIRPIKKIVNKYTIDNTSVFSINNVKKKLYKICKNFGESVNHLSIGMYRTISNKVTLDYTTVTDYIYSEYGLSPTTYYTQKTQYSYDGYVGLPTSVILTKSENSQYGKTYLETHNIYPKEGLPTNKYGDISGLIDNHIISQPLEVSTYNSFQNYDGKKPISSTKYTYSKTFSHYSGGNSLLQKISTKKGGLDFEDRMIYHAYDDYGNPLEISKPNSAHTVYIWGYNSTYPVAKIENATYNEVSSYVTAIQNASNADNDRTLGLYSGNEGVLRRELNKLRTNLKEAMVTTYTYDPLIGVTSVTDPKGYTIYYHYDDFNRLEFVKDQDGNIIKDHKYNYATN